MFLNSALLKRLFIFFIFLFPAFIYAFDFTQTENPKSYNSHLRLQYNFTYDSWELDGKVSDTLRFFDLWDYEFGLLSAIQIYLLPEQQLSGYYPVDNLIGYFGLYLEKTDWRKENLDMLLYPMVHESTHLVDGYDRGVIEDDRVYDSNEYGGSDFCYELEDWKFYGGFIYYYYYFNWSNAENKPRPLRVRIHLGQDFVYPISDDFGIFFGSDFAVFYEDGFHPAINLGAGIDLGRWKFYLHYEHQRGLGQNFDETFDRIGISVSLI